jgi:hypothetical protein
VKLGAPKIFQIGVKIENGNLNGKRRDRSYTKRRKKYPVTEKLPSELFAEDRKNTANCEKNRYAYRNIIKITYKYRNFRSFQNYPLLSIVHK